MFKTDLTKFSVLGDIVAHLEVILLGTSGLWEGVLWCKYFHWKFGPGNATPNL